MDMTILSDKSYHTLLRRYRNYMNVCVEKNRESSERVTLLSLEKYSELFISQKEVTIETITTSEEQNQ